MMTDQQKHEIESLRKEGLSYRQIAERVGATHACIKTCSVPFVKDNLILQPHNRLVPW